MRIEIHGTAAEPRLIVLHSESAKERAKKMTERFDITITMSVTKAQSITLSAMFDYWNQLSSMGSSRKVAFYVDGDGNFHPNCKVVGVTKISELHRKLAIVEDIDGDRVYDFDPVAWSI